MMRSSRDVVTCGLLHSLVVVLFVAMLFAIVGRGCGRW